MPTPAQFTHADVDLLNRLMALHPEFHETAVMVKAILATSHFPIHSFDDLAEGLAKSGGFMFRGRQMTADQVKALVPSYYFPIASERDLLAKISELQKIKNAVPVTPPEPPGVDIKWSTRTIPLPANAAPQPNLTSADVFKRFGSGHQVAGVGDLS